MWQIALAIILILLLIYRGTKSKSDIKSESKPESNFNAGLSNVGVRNTNVADPNQPWRDPALYRQLKEEVNKYNSDSSDNLESDLTFINGMKAIDQPDSVANAGKINYGPATSYQAPMGGLSSGEIQEQLPNRQSPCNAMREIQQMRNIDLQRKLFYGGNTPDCASDQIKIQRAMNFPRFVWQAPSSLSFESYPEDSPFDPIIPFHL